MRTVVGTFEDSQAAQTAVDQLVAQGFAPARIHLQTPPPAVEPSMDTEPNTGVLAGMGHFFSNLFESDEKMQAERDAFAARSASTLVAVDVLSDADVDKAHAVLEQFAAATLGSRAEHWRNQQWTDGESWARDERAFDQESEPVSDDLAAHESVPLLREDAAVRKRLVDVGGLRVVKRWVESPVSEVVTLRQERVRIERQPVDRAATEADFANFKPGTFEVREMAEEAVISKVARVVEEVSVRKDVSHHSEVVSDVVRRTDVDVEELPASEPLPANGHPRRL